MRKIAGSKQAFRKMLLSESGNPAGPIKPFRKNVLTKKYTSKQKCPDSLVRSKLEFPTKTDIGLSSEPLKRLVKIPLGAE